MMYDGYVVSTIKDSAKISDLNMTDIGMVKDCLSKRLEAEAPHFRLYLEYRDAPLGFAILHNIQKAVDKSRRIIIVLTENFLKVFSIKCIIYRASSYI